MSVEPQTTTARPLYPPLDQDPGIVPINWDEVLADHRAELGRLTGALITLQSQLRATQAALRESVTALQKRPAAATNGTDSG